MARNTAKNFIVDLKSSPNLKDLGREGFERKKINDSGFKSPRILFILDSAFQETIAHLGFQNELKKEIDFNEIQKIQNAILQNDLPQTLVDQIEEKCKEWEMIQNNMMLEVRLCNVDNNINYLEQLRSIVVKNSEDIINEIKRSFVDGLKHNQKNITVQIVEIPSYDVSGFVYVNKQSGEIEVNSVYGLWFNDRTVTYYDLCFANIENLEVTKYAISKQQRMLVKNNEKIVEIAVADSWQKSNKISENQLQSILEKSKYLLNSFEHSIEFSFGIFKNEIYIHDLRFLKTEFFTDEYSFADDFFSNKADQESFKSDIDAVANIELPFFLREDIKKIEQNVERNSKKGVFLERLKNEIQTIKKSEFLEYKKATSINDLFQNENKFAGFLVEFELLLNTVNNLESSSPEKIYKILKQNLISIQTYFSSLKTLDKEVILKLSKLENNKKESANHHFTNTLDLVPLRKVGFEILAFKKILENKDNNTFLNRISLSLPQLRSNEEVEFVLSILNLSRTEKLENNRIKLYIDLSIPSLLFEYFKKESIYKHLFDGYIINLNEFMIHFYNKKTFSKNDYETAVEYLELSLEKAGGLNVMLIVKEIEKSFVTKLHPELLIVE